MKKLVLSMVCGLLLGGVVVAQDVKYNFDQNADFTKYKTYKWEQHPKSLNLDQLTLKDLGAAFDAELAKKGLTRIESGTPDLVMVYQIAVSQEQEITSFNTGYGYGPGWRGGWYGGMGSSMSTATTSTINIGSVVVDMYDAAKKELVWRGTATKTVDSNSKPEKRRKNMAKGAEKLFKNYPPKVKK
jgi:hypothetical protein